MAGLRRRRFFRWTTSFWRKRPGAGVLAILLVANAARGAFWESSPSDLRTDGIGGGFRAGTESLSLEAGGDYGLTILGSREGHDLTLVNLGYGHMLDNVMGSGHWYGGNGEGRIELFGGSQFSPNPAWVVGLTPMLRYDLATETRWVPFIDGGAGVTATEIRLPDLSNTFEFNIQGGLGFQWFTRYNLALTFEARYFHLSDAGITHPNFGVNGAAGMIGLTWFF